MFLGPRFADKIFVGLLVMALYWQIGTMDGYNSINNQTAMLFMVRGAPGGAPSTHADAWSQPLHCW